MALIGGGGAGNVAGGANPAGVGTSLNYIGDHAYANSGFLIFVDSEITLLEFETGNSYIEASLVLMRNDQNSNDSRHKIYIDSQLVGSIPQNSGGIQMGGQPILYLFPPQSKIRISVVKTDTSVDELQGAVSLTGRVY
jgi:hypothetical protein